MIRRGGLVVASAVVLFGATFSVGACVLAVPRYKGPVSDHFDGDAFFNPWNRTERGPADLVKWRVDRDPGPWREWTDAPPGRKPPERVSGGAMRATFVNHATVLVQFDGLNILTDPIWSDRCGPFSWAGPKRVRPPGIRFEDLPPIDVVLISHNHYDHMDLPTLEKLARGHKPKFFVGLGNLPVLQRADITDGVEVDWWDEHALAPQVKLTSVPVQHFSGRSVADRNNALWTGYVIEGPSGKFYFSGDTGYGPHFADVGKKLGPFRLAVLPIGAFRPQWFMNIVHTSPAQAAQAHLDLGAKTSLAVHFGTFPLADDGQHEPVRVLADALGLMKIPRSQFWVLDFGEGREVP